MGKNTLKDLKYELKLFSRRSLYLFIVFAAAATILILRLLWLQILQHKLYVTLSDQNQINLVPIEPKRGLIYDRNGVLLADNTPVYSLVMIPGRVSSIERTLANLNLIIPISDTDLHLFYRELEEKRRFQEVPIKSPLSEEEMSRFMINQYRFPGVMVKAQLIRHYPEGPDFVHALGYMGRINETELKTINPTNYAGSHYIGKLGVEKAYENDLHGQVGYQQVEVDASGRTVRTLKRIAPVSGDKLYLTLDSRLQLAARNALGNTDGALVAIDPNNGDVLAFVSTPTFDPNLFVRGISTPDYRALREQDARPLYNRALRGLYPIGSTIKPFLGLAALTDQVIHPEDTIYDPGYYQLKGMSGHTYHDWKKGGHGTVNLEKAIMQSCDTYFYNLALKMGIVRIDNVLNTFGFGALTGIDLEEELAGQVASPVWKKKHYHHAWFPGDTLNTVIGQGYTLATPLQLAHGVATLAMKGVSVTPHLMLMRVNEEGQVIKPVIKPQLEYISSDENWTMIHEAMTQVVANPAGTAYRWCHNTPYTLAAKTGTAQVFSLKNNEHYNAKRLAKNLWDNHLFIAFAPVDHPKIAIATITEHSEDAARVTRAVLDAYLVNPQN